VKRRQFLSFFLLFLWAEHSVLAAIEVRDDVGRAVRVDEPVQRIVSLAPHATELLFEVGVGERIVGTVSFSNYPAAARRIPHVGGYDNLDIEAIVALKPDLIVAWHSGNRHQQIERLSSLGLTVFYTEVRRIGQIPSLLRRFAKLTDHWREGDSAAQAFETKLVHLRETYSATEKVRVFYQVWNNPLMTINDEHFISAVLRLCGGTNVFAKLNALAPTISLEAVLAANPEMIVTSGMGELHGEWLKQWRQWKQLRAVETKNLVLIPPDLLQRPTSRLLEGTELLCREIEKARARLDQPLSR